MGVPFREPNRGRRSFSCIFCYTFIVYREDLVSAQYTGSTGEAMLFNKAYNLKYGEREEREMLTGIYMVRYVSCKNCKEPLGWIYDLAVEKSQRYKERRLILERSRIIESCQMK